MQTVVMPKMGDTMEEGKILTWHKRVGDPVEKGESLAEVETDKVNIEAESFFDGVLRRILVGEGETVPVGAPIALVGAVDEPLPEESASAARRAAAPARRAPGSHAEAAPEATAQPLTAQPLTAQPLTAQPLTAQPLTAQPLTAQPLTAQPPVAEGRTRPEQPAPAASMARQPMGALAQPASGARRQAAAPTNGHVASAGETSAEATGMRVFISPIARRIAQEHALDISGITGTGPGGRIVREDVEAALAQAQPTAPAQPVTTPQPAQPALVPAAVPAAVTGDEVEVIPLSNMRRTIARRLQQSMQTAPHFYVTVAVDTTALERLRAEINRYAATLPEPVKVSLNDLIVRGVALALARMPAINVSFDNERLLRKKRVHIGVAVALEQGLIVPVVRDADKRGLLDIARETRRLGEAARTGKLKPEEFSGGTFSVSNLGMFGVEEFTAVINPPESAILAVGASELTPVVVEGQVVVRQRMKMTLSVDHRAIDGAQAARFLRLLKQLLEQPLGLLL